MTRHTIMAMALVACLVGCSADTAPTSTDEPSTGDTSTGTSESTDSTGAVTDPTTGGATNASAAALEVPCLDLDISYTHSVQQVGMMHCCIKWKDRCKCYSTLDGDCRPCFDISN